MIPLDSQAAGYTNPIAWATVEFTPTPVPSLNSLIIPGASGKNDTIQLYKTNSFTEDTTITRTINQLNDKIINNTEISNASNDLKKRHRASTCPHCRDPDLTDT